MSLEIELPDGTILEAPDNADPEVVAKNYLSQQTPQTPQTPQDPQQQKRGLFEEIGRAAQMQTLEFGKGAARLVMMPVDAAHELIELVKQAADGEVSLESLTNFKQNLQPHPDAPSRPLIDFLTSMQPQPENEVERFATRTAGMLGGAAAGIGAGRALAGTTLESLAVEPGRQAAGVAGASVASQAAEEAGGGPVAQTVAGLAGGLTASGAVPSAVSEGTRRAIRGGEAGRQRVEENIRTFEGAGTTPSVGQAVQNRRTQATESLLSRAPGSAGVMEGKSASLSRDLGQRVEGLADDLSPQASATQAGRAIQRGITDEGGFLSNFKDRSSKLYDQIDKHIKPSSSVSVKNTQKTLANLTKVVQGAEATTGRLVNKRLANIAEDIKADASDGTLPYEALKVLRTRVGDELADASLMSDVPTAQWKQLYKALSQDLEAAASAAGPKARQAYDRANRFYRAGSTRIDDIQSVINKNGGPEAVFRAATAGTKEGATTLRAVMQSLPKNARKTLSATVLRRMGRAKPGQQDDLAEVFSTETFLTNWASMSGEAKLVLFNRYGPNFRKDMDQIAKVAANLRSGSKVFRNPSGTAQAGIQHTTAGGFIMSILTGNLGVASAIATGVGGTNLAAKLMTHPPFVKWLAKSTRRPVESAPVLINQLAQSDDPLLQEAAKTMQEATTEAN